MKKAIILLSGGLDSATTLFYAKNKKFRCICLNFFYGQKHKREIESAKKIAAKAGCPLVTIKIDIPKKASALTSAEKNINDTSVSGIGKKIPATYVPARNIIFLSFALSWAEAEKCGHIFIGANAVDYSGYPDCRPEFIKAFQEAARAGTKSGAEGRMIKIEAPLILKTKAQIIKAAKKLNVPLELTWSCYRGGKLPCGRCESCRLRAKGFEEAGVDDPLSFSSKVKEHSA
ncbi:MAG: 7-cyano-7-deazaguanine synthase QueC [Candidatus Omnitrophota bacterium]